MAAVPSIGRATSVEQPVAPGAAAAGALYERYSGQILSYCLHQLGSREEAEDAVQTTFMNAFRGLQRGIVPELESAWLFKIAHNVCLSRRRSSWRRGKVEAPNNFEVLQEVVPGRDQVADELIRLQDVLEEMPENQRRAILLREWQGLTYREISSELGLSQSAVETLIFRARRTLAQGLEQGERSVKKRFRRGADVGGVVASFKALLGGGGAAAVKVAATAIAVGTTAVAGATDSTPRQRHPSPSLQPVVTVKAPPQRSARPRAASGTPVALAASLPEPKTGPRSSERRVSRPVTRPAISIPEQIASRPVEPATAPETTPAPATTEPPIAPPPADDKGKDKGEAERTPQSTLPPPVESEPGPPPLPEPLPEPLPPPGLITPGHEDKVDEGKPGKRDKEDRAEDHANNGIGQQNVNK